MTWNVLDLFLPTLHSISINWPNDPIHFLISIENEQVFFPLRCCKVTFFYFEYIFQISISSVTSWCRHFSNEEKPERWNAQLNSKLTKFLISLLERYLENKRPSIELCEVFLLEIDIEIVFSITEHRKYVNLEKSSEFKNMPCHN